MMIASWSCSIIFRLQCMLDMKILLVARVIYHKNHAQSSMLAHCSKSQWSFMSLHNNDTQKASTNAKGVTSELILAVARSFEFALVPESLELATA